MTSRNIEKENNARKTIEELVYIHPFIVIKSKSNKVHLCYFFTINIKQSLILQSQRVTFYFCLIFVVSIIEWVIVLWVLVMERYPWIWWYGNFPFSFDFIFHKEHKVTNCRFESYVLVVHYSKTSCTRTAEFLGSWLLSLLLYPLTRMLDRIRLEYKRVHLHTSTLQCLKSTLSQKRQSKWV